MPHIRLSDLPHYTYDEYCHWQGEWEIIYGIAYAMTPAPIIQHQKISQKIAQQLGNLLEECPNCTALLPIDWKISDDTIVQPDNLIICHPASGSYLTKAPLMIFEILSKSTASKDKGIKFELYQNEGVKYYIIVDPGDKIAKVYDLVNGKYIKRLDANNETESFSLKDCVINFSFSNIFT